MNKSLSYIADSIGGKLSDSANGNRIVDGFFSDSRTPSETKMFLALRGERVDGNSFVPALAEQGYCAITDREENLSLKGDIIFVPDVREGLQKLAIHYRKTELSNLPIIGITGSVGKTTTKDMVAVALSSGMNVYKTLGNSNSQIGLPQTILGADMSYNCAVVELGMSMKGEMERISRCAMPNISIITNIGYSHIENLGSREAIRDEKLKIAAFSDESSVLLLNGDELLLRKVNSKNTVYYVSVEDKNCHTYASGITETSDGVCFTATVFGKTVDVKLNVKGKHFVINSLFALSAAHLMGLDISVAAKKLSCYESDGKRQHIYQHNGHTVISDCYNASPESMGAALSVLSTYKTRRIAVLGDMLELGSQSEFLHKTVGEYTNNSADVLITYGNMAKLIAESSNVKEKYTFEENEREKLSEFLKSFIKNGDTVLYKGSNGMKLSEFIV